MPRKTALFLAALAAWITAGALAGSCARAQPTAPISAFGQEQQMGFAALMQRWDPLISQASRRFGVPEKWIRIVIPNRRPRGSDQVNGSRMASTRQGRLANKTYPGF